MLTGIVALDLETTGFSPSEDGIIEISALRVEDGGCGRHLSTLVNPGRPIPRAATAIHGLQDLDVASAPTTAEALESLLEFLSPPETLLVAHNAEFDASFLGHGFLRMERELPGNPVLDSLSLAREVWPGVPSRSLEALAQGYGIEGRQKHRALADCETLARVLPLLIRDRPPTAADADLEGRARPFPEMAFPPAPTPPGWEELDLTIREGRGLDLRWKALSGPLSARLQPLRLVRRGWRVSLLARDPDGGRTLEVALRDVLEVDGRRPPPPPPFVPSLRDRVIRQIGDGASLNESAAALGMEPSDALRHLCDALAQGQAPDFRHLVVLEALEPIRACLDSNPDAPLSGLGSSRPPDVDWVQMKLGLACWYAERAGAVERQKVEPRRRKAPGRGRQAEPEGIPT